MDFFDILLAKKLEDDRDPTIEGLSVTENGTYTEENKAYNPVIVNVPEPTLITKSITANGTYTASDDNADGYSGVTVAVEGFKKKSIANTPTDIASFNDGTANPMPSLEISIEPVQSGSGDPSPSNVRPISGWSGANVKRCGNNLVSSKITKCNISSNGTLASANEYDMQIAYVKAGKTYTAINSDSSTPLIAGFFTDNPVIGSTSYNQERVIISGGTTITAPIDGWISFRTANGFDRAQLELGSTATAYTPYQGSTLSIPFHDSNNNPITVYGGRLNVTSGELTADRVSIVIDENSSILQWTTPQSPWVGFYYVPNPYMQSGRITNLKSNYLKSADSVNAWNVYGVNGILYLTFNADVIGGETLNDIKGFLETHPLQVVYPLATPQTYQLTPAQVTTLLGQNNIFADCGQILEGEYFVTL